MSTESRIQMIALNRQVDALFEHWNRTDSPGCVLGVVQSGKLIYQRAYGMADLERNVPLNPNSVFDIGSTGKQFAAMQIALLAQRSMLNIDDPVQKYIPELPQYEQPITIRHLLHHTSGLRDYLVLLILAGKTFDVTYSVDDLLELTCRQQSLNFAPGDEFLYSNTGYFLLGVIASRVANMPFPDLLRTTFFETLGMTSSDMNDDPARITKNRALSYTQNAEGAFRTEPLAPGGFGDGPLLSTIEDLFRWDQNFYDNRLGGGNALIEQMITSGRFNDGSEIGYGLGLFISRYRGLPVIHHGGAWAGYRAELIRFPEQQFSVICLANLGKMSPSRLAKQVADIYLADWFPEALQSEAIESATRVPYDLSPYEGFYQNPKSRELLEVTVKDNEPLAVLSGYPLKLAVEGERQWRVTNLPYAMHFEVEGEAGSAHLIARDEFNGGRPETYRRFPMSSVSPEQLSEAAGEYVSDELGTRYTLIVKDDQLHVRIGSTSPKALRAVNRDTFIDEWLTIELARDSGDRIKGMNVSGGRVRNVRLTR